MIPPIKKAVFPVAGMGTRFLPATKASPKEMLPIVDKPLIQYAVEEAVAAGCDEMIFVTGRNKRAIADHFDSSFELEYELERKQKTALLDSIRGIVPDHVSIVYLRQPKALGLGHAIRMTQRLVGNEPFAVLLADDLIQAQTPCLQQMIDMHRRYGGSMLAVEQVPEDKTDQYGVVACAPVGQEKNLFSVSDIVEKPPLGQAPSNMAVVGRYLLSPSIFPLLHTTEPGKGGEIQLTDAIASLLRQEAVMAYSFDGLRHDCGDKLGYLKAVVEHAAVHPDFGPDFLAYLQQRTHSTP